jgi:hypothetical protein
MGRSEERIEVIAYSGYRGEENPRTIFLQSRRIEVIGILKQWIQEGSDSREIKRFYQLKGSDGNLHTICYDEKIMGWFYINRKSFPL